MAVRVVELFEVGVEARSVLIVVAVLSIVWLCSVRRAIVAAVLVRRPLIPSICFAIVVVRALKNRKYISLNCRMCWALADEIHRILLTFIWRVISRVVARVLPLLL